MTPVSLRVAMGAALEDVPAVVIDRVLERAVRRADDGTGPPIDLILGETLFHERGRLAHADRARAGADREFYSGVRHAVSSARAACASELLRAVVTHYADEIHGHFDRRVYAVATRALPVGLTALLSGLSPRELLARRRIPNLEEHVVIDGEVDALRTLARRGTIILVPTHSSNLDSLVMGNSIFRLGLPPFSYGAGLNLFTNPLTGFFMSHLGAYTVDRHKTDPLYRETLKEYATVLLERAQHNLFFPGGTRSRSGAIESHVKKGLLGTGITATLHNLRAGRDGARIFVVPATCSYPLVLEAESLVSDYLEEAGRSRYVLPEDEFNRVQRWVDFLGGLLTLDLRIELVIGRPLDPFGNDVDLAGVSRDPRGRAVDAARYLRVDGAPTDDPARDAEYTRRLGARVVAAYRRDNVALPTNILAFAFLEILRRRAPRLDLYRLLRSLGPDTSVPLDEVVTEVKKIVHGLATLASRHEIRLSRQARDAGAVIPRALATFGTYHRATAIRREGDRLHVGDANLVFFYRNRLEGYGLGEPLIPQRSDA